MNTLLGIRSNNDTNLNVGGCPGIYVATSSLPSGQSLTPSSTRDA